MAFLEALKKLEPDALHLHFDDEAGGKFLDIAAAVAEAPAGAHLYCCGPKPMLAAFEAATANRPHGLVHVEYFTPKSEAATTGGFWVELARSGEEYYIPEGKKILEVLYEAGIDVYYSCELGICGACETKVISGIPEHHSFRAQRGRAGLQHQGHDLLRRLQVRAAGAGFVNSTLGRYSTPARGVITGKLYLR